MARYPYSEPCSDGASVGIAPEIDSPTQIEDVPQPRAPRTGNYRGFFDAMTVQGLQQSIASGRGQNALYSGGGGLPPRAPSGGGNNGGGSSSSGGLLWLAAIAFVAICADRNSA